MAKIPVFLVGDWAADWRVASDQEVWHLATPAAYYQYSREYGVGPIDVGTQIECWCGPIIRHHHNPWSYGTVQDPGLCTACLERFWIWAMTSHD